MKCVRRVSGKVSIKEMQDDIGSADSSHCLHSAKMRTYLRVPSSFGEERRRVVRSFCVIISSLGYFRRKSRLW